MGRSYAGILGPLAFFTEIFRGVFHSAGTEATVTSAIVALIAFAAIGFVLGELAGWVVDDSIRSRLAAEIASAKPKTAAAKPTVAAQTAAPPTAVSPITVPPTAAKPNPIAAPAKPNPQPAKPNPPKPAAAPASSPTPKAAATNITKPKTSTAAAK